MVNGRPVRCPGCSKAQREDCDGNGRLAGGVTGGLDWSPVKAFRKCPKFKGEVQNTGAKFGDILDNAGTLDSSVMLVVPAVWRSLTRIRLREYADLKAEATGDYVNPYEKFDVVEVIFRGGQHYLKLRDKKGWAFDRG
eukprot:CAMPEP_0168634080 /NCGR_PEP_ID=MMETSP0503-20121227/2784_1 /TAXON_ID=89963 /ORGANISM="Heterocapsa rotundata, Strain SCCAP K-0483" /LENGTH=137 /DNA_ID=CAMNT_0008677063 /DNA_START=9 /DNA_END=419 /DNA_ORIENTATION=+